MDKTHFWLIRHGETEWNANRRLQGWLDIPLSDVGLEQARQLGTYLQTLESPRFGAVLSSDLSRAAETARLATAHLGLTVTTTPELRERNYGVHQGLDWHALSDGLAEKGINLRDPDQAVEQGESLRQFAQRVRAAFERLARVHAGQSVLVFAHGGVIDIAWRLAGGHSLTTKREGSILNTSISAFDIRADGVWTMGPWNQVGHLEDIPTLDDVMHT